MSTLHKNKNKYTIGLGKANLYAFLISIPLTIVLFLTFHFIWNFEKITLGMRITMDYFFHILITGVIIHELLHGFTWAIFASKTMKSIRFGFKWKYLTPYCHCKEALKVKHYKIGILMPLVILGTLPLMYGIIVGNGIVFLWGTLFTCIATGDIIVLFFLRKLNNECYIFDDPDDMGFYIKNIPKVDIDIK